MSAPIWSVPSEEFAAWVTTLLRARQAVFQHVLDDGSEVELSQAGSLWILTWTGKADAPWPDGAERDLLLRVELAGRRQQTWVFMEETQFDWAALLRDKWGLEPRLTSGRLA